MDKRVKERWVELLESGEYSYVDGMLYDQVEDCHCVLGVLVELALEEEVFEPVLNHNKTWLEDLTSWSLNDKIRKWAGLSRSEVEEIAARNDNMKTYPINYIKENL